MAMKHEREDSRLDPSNRMKCAAQHKRLLQEKPSEVIGAAEELGKLKFAESFRPLMNALGRSPGDTNREVQAAILRALAEVGSEHEVSQFKFASEPLKQFCLSHIGDPELVRLGLDAMGWTGTVEQTAKAALEIADAARQGGNSETAGAASSFYMDSILR
jgi:hypothetical protein